MPTAAEGPASPSDRPPAAAPPMQVPPQAVPAAAPQVVPVISEAFAKDAIIAWFRGEFAAANAIIDALCSHLTQLSPATGGGGGGLGSEYESVFAAIHRRRLNWIPILQMQKFYSIADVELELRKVAEKKKSGGGDGGAGGGGNQETAKDDAVAPINRAEEDQSSEGSMKEKSIQSCEIEVVDDDSGGDDSQESQITDAGSQSHSTLENIEICSNHEDCEARPSQIKLTKGFVGKEPVKGHMVNVMKGLKLFEDILTQSELAKLTDFVNELRAAGHNGELSGETFILFNQQMKGNRRELIQFGVPIFGHIREDETTIHQMCIEPIPALLQSLINHLVLWQLVPEYKRPSSCIINFFDEGEHSQPFLKPPHLDQPVITLLLSDSMMAFGRTLTNDNEGHFKGQLMLSLKEGSLLVMRGNSADMARHVICSSPTKRISISFFRVRPESNQNQMSTIPPQKQAMTLWQPSILDPYTMQNGIPNGYEIVDPVSKWGIVRAPMVLVAPVDPACPVMLSPKKIPNGGTGVFLPWTNGSRKPVKHLPPRAQKGRLLALPSPFETHVEEPLPL